MEVAFQVARVDLSPELLERVARERSKIMAGMLYRLRLRDTIRQVAGSKSLVAGSRMQVARSK